MSDGSSTRRTRPGCSDALPKDQLPKHIGVMLDGNRRWAKAVGGDSAHGYRAGAANIEPLLDWCDEVGVEVVTLWLLSTDNLNRPAEQLARLLGIIEGAVTGLADQQRWRLHPVGALDLLPAATAQVLKDAEDAHPSTSTGCWSTSPSGTAAGARSPTRCGRCCRSTRQRGTSLEELAEVIDVEHIAEHLYTKGQPDPDLVIRTSGEQRLGGFLLWQSRAERVLLLRGATGRTSAGSTSCGPSAPTPSATAATAPERLTRRWSGPLVASTSNVHPDFGRVAANRLVRRRTFDASAGGEARRTGRQVRGTSRPR